MTSDPLPDLSRLGAFDCRLREVATDRENVARARDLATSRLDGTDEPAERARLLGYMGNAERMLGHTGPAIAYFRSALDLMRASGDVRGEAVALIRLGEAYRCADEPGQAEALLREALEATENGEAAGLRDFALQHLGKCLVELGRRDEAVAALDEALLVRRTKGDAALVESTQQALAWARGDLAAT